MKHHEPIDPTPIKLPEPKYEGSTSVEKAIYRRRSIRDYKHEPFSIADVSQLLWAAQGTTALGGYRTAPSAGALYPLELYLVAGNVEGLLAGVYHYDSHHHAMVMVDAHDRRAELSTASLDQTWMQAAAVTLVLTAMSKKTSTKYGHKSIGYVYMEVGAAAENVCLQGVSMNMASVMVGSFDEARVKKILPLKDGEEPLCLIPVGRK